LKRTGKTGKRSNGQMYWQPQWIYWFHPLSRKNIRKLYKSLTYCLGIPGRSSGTGEAIQEKKTILNELQTIMIKH